MTSKQRLISTPQNGEPLETRRTIKVKSDSFYIKTVTRRPDVIISSKITCFGTGLSLDILEEIPMAHLPDTRDQHNNLRERYPGREIVVEVRDTEVETTLRTVNFTCIEERTFYQLPDV